MAVIKSFILALSTYSKIPMPNLDFKEKQGRFMLCFFPVVGVIIGGILYGFYLLSWYTNFNSVASAIGYLLIPIVITGGIHIDGFMDSMDAINSYKSKEEKLNILSDPHIGAFCVIKLVELIGILLFSYIVIYDYLIKLTCYGFVISRILSALSIYSFPGAKETGMVAYTKKNASKACPIVLVLELICICFICINEYKLIAMWPLITIVLSFGYYRYKVEKDFEGITGDTAGCFLVMAEACWIMTVAIFSIVRAL